MIPMIRDSDKNNVAEYLFEDLMVSKMLRQQFTKAEQQQERLTADEFHILYNYSEIKRLLLDKIAYLGIAKSLKTVFIS